MIDFGDKPFRYRAMLRAFLIQLISIYCKLSYTAQTDFRKSENKPEQAQGKIIEFGRVYYELTGNFTLFLITIAHGSRLAAAVFPFHVIIADSLSLFPSDIACPPSDLRIDTYHKRIPATEEKWHCQKTRVPKASGQKFPGF